MVYGIRVVMVMALGLTAASCSGARVHNAATPGANATAAGIADATSIERISIDRTFWIPGEQMHFEVTMRGVTGLRSAIVVGEPGKKDGRPVIVIRSLASTSTLVSLVKSYSEEATTLIDIASGAALRRDGRRTIDEREIAIASRFSDGKVAHELLDSAGESRQWNQDLPKGEPVFDNQGILGVVRAWTPSKGTAAYFYALTDELLHRHVIRFMGPETLRTKGGYQATLRYDVEVFARATYAPGSGFTRKRDDQSYRIWVTDDATRRPLRLTIPHRYGRIEMTLVDYVRPRRTR